MTSTGRSGGNEHPGGRSSENDGPNALAAAGGNEGAHGQTADDKLESFAEDLGRFLGTVENRATNWLGQRQAIAEQLTQIRDTANNYLQQLAGEGARLAEAVQRGRRGRPAASRVKRGPGRPPGSAMAPSPTIPKRTMSAEARRRIGQAQKKRWAKLKKEQG
jgi:hypothetical protein